MAWAEHTRLFYAKGTCVSSHVLRKIMRKAALFSGNSCGRTKDPLSPLSPALPKLQFSLLTILQTQKSDQRRYHDRRGHCPLYSKPGIICKTVAGRSCFQLKDRIGGDQAAVRESQDKSLHKIPCCMKSGYPEEAVFTDNNDRCHDPNEENVQKIREFILKHAFSADSMNLKLVYQDAGEYAGAINGAALAVHGFFLNGAMN